MSSAGSTTRGWGSDPRADAVARRYAIKLPPLPSGYCTYYSEKHGGPADEKHVVELAEFAAKNLKPYGFEFVQIDYNWEAGVESNGPPKNFTQPNPKGPYSHGMKGPADAIRRLGLTPGLWFMPFAGTYNDPWFAGHEDWFVKRSDGKPYDVVWTGTCFDMTDPGAQSMSPRWSDA